jgi:hypothetical protein
MDIFRENMTERQGGAGLGILSWSAHDIFAGEREFRY